MLKVAQAPTNQFTLQDLM